MSPSTVLAQDRILSPPDAATATESLGGFLGEAAEAMALVVEAMRSQEQAEARVRAQEEDERRWIEESVRVKDDEETRQKEAMAVREEAQRVKRAQLLAQAEACFAEAEDDESSKGEVVEWGERALVSALAAFVNWRAHDGMTAIHLAVSENHVHPLFSFLLPLSFRAIIKRIK